MHLCHTWFSCHGPRGMDQAPVTVTLSPLYYLLNINRIENLSVMRNLLPMFHKPHVIDTWPSVRIPENWKLKHPGARLGAACWPEADHPQSAGGWLSIAPTEYQFYQEINYDTIPYGKVSSLSGYQLYRTINYAASCCIIAGRSQRMTWWVIQCPIWGRDSRHLFASLLCGNDINFGNKQSQIVWQSKC